MCVCVYTYTYTYIHAYSIHMYVHMSLSMTIFLQWADLALEAKETDYKLGKIKRSFREVTTNDVDKLVAETEALHKDFKAHGPDSGGK